MATTKTNKKATKEVKAVANTQVGDLDQRLSVLEKRAEKFSELMTADYSQEKIKVKFILPKHPIFTSVSGGTHEQIFDNQNAYKSFKEVVKHFELFGKLAPSETFTLVWEKWYNGTVVEELTYSWKGKAFAGRTMKLLKEAVKYSNYMSSETTDMAGVWLDIAEMMQIDELEKNKLKYEMLIGLFLSRQSLAEALPMVKAIEKLDTQDFSTLAMYLGNKLAGMYENELNVIEAMKLIDESF